MRVVSPCELHVCNEVEQGLGEAGGGWGLWSWAAETGEPARQLGSGWPC